MGAIGRLANLAAVVMLSAAACSAAQAQPAQYPARPVRFVVPFTPGGGADLGAREIAARMSEQLKQQFVIDNRGGGGGVIGMMITADAAADGYTLLFTSASYGAVIAAHKSASGRLRSAPTVTCFRP